MNRERLVNEFIEMVKISSVTGMEGRFAKVLEEKLKALGFEVYIDNAGEKAGCDTGNVVGKLKGSKNGPAVLFGAHMDTVSPGTNIQPVIRDGIIYSDGTTILGSDDKAGIAAILEAVRYLKEQNIPHGDIEVAFTIAEEGGMFGAKNLDYGRLSSKMAFILDSGGDIGGVIIQGPAQIKIFSNIKGRSAHAGVSPEAGVSAIQVAAHAIAGMKLLRIDPETTANVGTIKGGTTTNVVCDFVETSFEARSHNQEKLEAQTAHMLACIKDTCAAFGAQDETTHYLNYPAFTIPKDAAILKVTESAMNRIGRRMELKSTGGGSDTNIMSGNGIQAVTLAIGMNNVHTTSENIAISDLLKTAELVSAIIQEAGME